MRTYRIKIRNTLNGLEFTQDKDGLSADDACAAFSEEIRRLGYATWSILEITEAPAAEERASASRAQVSLSSSERSRNVESVVPLLAESTPRLVITPVIMGLNTCIFVLMVLSGVSALKPQPSQLVPWGANFGLLTFGGQWWRLFSSTFVHIGVLHLMLNMWALWSLGALAERMFGKWMFLLLYVLAGLGGSIASLAWNPEVVSAGASGAIFGVVGGLIMLLGLEKLRVPLTESKQTLTSLLMFVGYNLVNGFKESGVDNAAHLGGLVLGLVLGALLHRPLPPVASPSRVRKALVVTGVTISLLVGVELTRQLHPAMVKFWTAVKLLGAGDTQQAIMELQNVVARKPDFAMAHYYLGNAYLKQERYDESAASYPVVSSFLSCTIVNA